MEEKSLYQYLFDNKLDVYLCLAVISEKIYGGWDNIFVVYKDTMKQELPSILYEFFTIRTYTDQEISALEKDIKIFNPSLIIQYDLQKDILKENYIDNYGGKVLKCIDLTAYEKSVENLPNDSRRSSTNFLRSNDIVVCGFDDIINAKNYIIIVKTKELAKKIEKFRKENLNK